MIFKISCVFQCCVSVPLNLTNFLIHRLLKTLSKILNNKLISVGILEMDEKCIVSALKLSVDTTICFVLIRCYFLFDKIVDTRLLPKAIQYYTSHKHTEILLINNFLKLTLHANLKTQIYNVYHLYSNIT